MAIDLTALHQVFFEESFEGLQVMESALLGLDLDNTDAETINAIFRAAHSIKGGGGTFGFMRVSEFTHDLETLLDEIRAGKRPMTAAYVDLFLICVDVLREMLEATREKQEVNEQRIGEVTEQLRLALGKETPAPKPTIPAAAVANHSAKGFAIEFLPLPHLMQTGNDPVRIFRELATLGDLTAHPRLGSLPSFNELNPENCHLAWELQLLTFASEAEVREVFTWVEDDCKLNIRMLAAPPAEVVSTSASETLAATPAASDDAAKPNLTLVADRRTGEDRRQAPDRRKDSEYSSIRVGIDKVDAIINMVGELVITQSMLSQIGKDFDASMIDRLRDGLVQLERNTRELQESVLNIRMLPISFSFNRFPRLVRDISAKLGKNIDLKMTGGETELDKTVLEKIGDPLVHLVRNCLDHGIEMPDVRLAKGKPEMGTLHLNAYHKGGSIIIEISDDGAGLNDEKILAKAKQNGLVAADAQPSRQDICELIFHPGLSTADKLSDISGRGVGMDVVRRNIKDLGGDVEVESESGKGTLFRVRLPLTLAILDGQLVRVGDQIFIIPLVSIVESLQVNTKHVNVLGGRGEVYRLRDEYLAIVRPSDVFGVDTEAKDLKEGLLVVVEADNQRVGLFVDDLLAQQQIVIKSLETNYRKVEGISGATILGDGKVALILDIVGMIALHRQHPRPQPLRVVNG